MLLLRVGSLRIARDGGRLTLFAEARGEEIDRQKHELSVDVKAVTLYRFGVVETEGGWKATVVLDL
jgi:SHS2 domain-containing protein